MIRFYYSLSVLVYCALVTCSEIHAQQDRVDLMNGKIMLGSIVDTSNGYVSLNYLKRKRPVSVNLEYSRLYSFTYAGKPETVLYYQDTAIGNMLTVKDMRYYILGERDAQEKYNPWGIKIAAGALSLGVVLADTYKTDSVHTKFMSGFLRTDPGLASIIAPFVITVLAAAPAVQIDIKKVSDRNYLNYESYIDGFERVGRSKKVFGSLKFSFGGALLGFGTYYLVKALR